MSPKLNHNPLFIKLVNKTNIIYLKKIIIPYSAIIIKANPPLLYSILNPEINSDSPSIKSMGLRFNSAKILIKNIKNKGNNININHIFSCHLIKSIKENLSTKIIKIKIIKIKLTS